MTKKVKHTKYLHSTRVSETADKIALNIEKSSNRLVHLFYNASLHDRNDSKVPIVALPAHIESLLGQMGGAEFKKSAIPAIKNSLHAAVNNLDGVLKLSEKDAVKCDLDLGKTKIFAAKAIEKIQEFNLN